MKGGKTNNNITTISVTKVASSSHNKIVNNQTTSSSNNNNNTSSSKLSLSSSSPASQSVSSSGRQTSSNTNNFDDDEKDWEENVVEIRDLIIDLDADIEGKEKTTTSTTSLTGHSAINYKDTRNNTNNNTGQETTGDTATITVTHRGETIGGSAGDMPSTNSNSSSSSSSGTTSGTGSEATTTKTGKEKGSHHHHHHKHHHHRDHHATDGGQRSSSETSSLKMKIKKTVGSRSSDVKHQVVLETSSSSESSVVKDKKNGVTNSTTTSATSTTNNNNHVHNKKEKKDKSVIRSTSPSSTVVDHKEKDHNSTSNLTNHHINESISSKKDMGTCTSIGTITEADCLGPCEPGTSVTLEGVVWHETETGVLVVNVTWRDKSYVGTLLDCTKHDWAPPRLCDSPSDDGLELKSGKTRGKRKAALSAIEATTTNIKGRPPKGRRTTNNSGFTIPASPGKSVDLKRKCELPSPVSKRSTLIECPEPNCNKKYKHINGLKYHQTHAHGEKNKASEEAEPESERETPVEEEASAVDGDTAEGDEQPEAMEVDGDQKSSEYGEVEELDKTEEPPKEIAAPSPAYSDISDAADESETNDDRTPNGLPITVANGSDLSAISSSRMYPFPFSYPVHPYTGGVTATGLKGSPSSQQSENHQILKESIELKDIMPSKDSKDVLNDDGKSSSKPSSSRLSPLPSKSSSPPPKDDGGMKPTMETTGPPPAPTNYFFGPQYFPVPGVAGVPVAPPFDPRFGPLPHAIFHPAMSRLPSGVPGAPSPPPSTEKKSPKALDLLHQVAFSGHKIHELGPSSSKSHSPPPSKIDCPPKDSTTSSISSSKSPPPQRHLHTHHHTHVGVGYPLYDPYGAAIIASQQAAASIHPFAPK